MPKDLKYGDDSRKLILDGIEQLARAVKVTLGPKGRNVCIDKKFGSPLITKDGVTVAKEIELKDPYANMGAEMVKEVASKTSDIAGDGTTTATVLAEAIFREGLKNVTAGANPMALKRGIEKAVKLVTDELLKISIPINGSKELTQIATISANNDSSIGNLISEAMERVGKNGVITVEESNTSETYLKIVDGVQFDQGYLSHYFVTNSEAMECVLENPFILIYEKKISSMKSLIPLLEKVIKNGSPILIISEDTDQDALSSLIMNKVRGVVNICAVKAPGYGDRRKELLIDVAILTGGKAITEDTGIKLEDISIDDLGRANRVTVNKDSTLIVGGLGNPDEIKTRITSLRNQINSCESDYDKEKLQERLGKMSRGIAVIKVGAITESEMKEKKDRIDDACHATKAAAEEGIVPGGGVALLRCIDSLNSLNLSGDEQIGVNIIKRAIEEPIRQIAINAGYEGSRVADEVKRMSLNEGFNAETGVYENLIESGVIDPTKVTRMALKNAASVISLLLTTEAMIIDITNEEVKK